MSIWIGTASWADQSLIDCGRFYPPDVKTAEARLRYYAGRFPLVELDSSFYAIPDPGMAELWARRTPEGFVMNAKAFRLFTGHQTSPSVLPADIREALPEALQRKSMIYYQDVPSELRSVLWGRFRAALAPLLRSGRLGLVHFQFAPWLLRNRAGHAHVATCVDHMDGFQLSVEFRNRSWFDGLHARETVLFERDLRLVHTVVDAPQGFGNSVPSIWESTHEDCALVRMHGRNASSWNHSGGHSGGRFDYLYDDAELEGLGWNISDLAGKAREVHVVMNNNNQDQAQSNGLSLMDAILEMGADVALPSEPMAAVTRTGGGWSTQIGV